MALDTRYETINELPESGTELAGKVLLENFLEVLQEASDNNAKQNGGASYNESDKPTRAISYVYALNSIYRELWGWQNKQSDNEQIVALRQEIREMFPYFMGKEFPLPPDSPVSNFEINDDCIQIESRDAATGKILDPQAFEIDDEQRERLDNFLEKIDSFIEHQYSSLQFTATKADDLEFQKKAMKTSADFMRKMQYYIARKAQGKEVRDFRTADEKARTFRNTFKKLIEKLTNIGQVKDSEFAQNSQTLANAAAALGMDVVWYQEPPYESEFVDHLDAMRKELNGETSAEFYNTQLPVFLDLCQNLMEQNPAETAELKAKYDKFFQNPDKALLTATIDEAQRVSQELRDIDYAKSRAMRAAWDGKIDNPPLKQISPFLQEIALIRTYIGNPNASPEMQKKVAAYNALQYKPEDYDFAKCKIWNICKQVPQFCALESQLISKAAAIGVPPEKVADLSYQDLAYLLNKTIASRAKTARDTPSVPIASDKSQYLKDLVTNHEKELRKSLQNYYQQKITMQLINSGVAQKKSDAKIQKKVTAEATEMTEKVLADMKNGIGNSDFNCHHVFALSNISYFEKMTGKPFTEINKNILFVNKDVHEILHLNENMMNYRGQVSIGQYNACRTKYVNFQKVLKSGRNVTGYIGRAFSFMLVPKPGIKAMIDFKSFIFDKNTLLENISVQKKLVELRRKNGPRKKIGIPAFNLRKIGEFLQKLLPEAKQVTLQTNAEEMQKARELDKMNKARRTGNIEVIDKTPQPAKAPAPSKSGNRLLSWHQDKKKKLRK